MYTWIDCAALMAVLAEKLNSLALEELEEDLETLSALERLNAIQDSTIIGFKITEIIEQLDKMKEEM